MIVLITGGTRGIGAAVADEFEADGASLILTGTSAEQVAALNESSTPNRRYVVADFADASSVQSLVEEISGLERLDVCVNNAGINIVKPFEDVVPEELDRLTAINYRAPYLVAQAAAAVMKKNQGGWIVNIASIWSTITKAKRSLYCASKAGLAGMTRAMATDLAKDNILVNAVSPGFTLTDMSRETLSSEERDALADQVPLGRLAQSAEIAKLVCFLCSPSNTYITGQNITIDGGFTHV